MTAKTPAGTRSNWRGMASLAFLRVPPFPRHRAQPITQADRRNAAGDAAALAAMLRRHRVGGDFWAAQPALPLGRDIVLAPDTRDQLAQMLSSLGAEERRRAVALLPAGWSLPPELLRLTGPCDPWWLAGQAAECRSGADNELALVAALAGVPLQVFGTGRFARCAASLDEVVADILLRDRRYCCPFTGVPMAVEAVIAQLGHWRRLIDANRANEAVYGIARWKRISVDPLLWDGTGAVRHRRSATSTSSRPVRAVSWRSRTPLKVLARLEREGCAISEIEDGMIRSAGLGANCVPPLSVVVDQSGIYFDPSAPSDLETILETSEFPPALCTRAASLRTDLIDARISKYGRGIDSVSTPTHGKRRILVAGQVEDDRSMLTGGAGCSNLKLISRARALEGNAWIVYKPHPDVLAGHRKGHVPDAEALRFADEVVRDATITALIDTVDEVHVITSLAGFEALLRGKEVITHGVPFYAGWGLTRDLAAVPARRTRRLSLDALVAGTLLLYPRYVDPVTRLPCSPERLVARLKADDARVASPLILLRTWQGRLQSAFRRLRGAA